MNERREEEKKKGETMLGAEEMEIKTMEWLKGAIRRIKKEEPVYVKKGLIRFTHFFWKIGRKPSGEDVEPISYFLDKLDFSFKGKKKNRLNFRHIRKKLHVEVIEERDGFRISAHIDVIPHFEIKRSKYTTRLLFELSRFLQWQYPHSKVIRKGEPEKPSLLKENFGEISRSTDQLNTEPKKLEETTEQRPREKKVLERSKPSSKSKLNEDRIKKSRESVVNLISEYKKMIKQESEEERLIKAKKEQKRRQFQENRDKIKRKEEDWKDLFKEIISDEIIREFYEVLDAGKFELDDRRVERRIKEKFHELLMNLDSADKGFFILDFNTFFDNNFYDQFWKLQDYARELSVKIKQERKEQEREIDEYIYGFLGKITRKLTDHAIKYKVQSFIRYPTMQLIEYYFKKELNAKNYPYSDWYLERFNTIFSRESTEIIDRMENRLKENAPLERKSLFKSIKAILQQALSIFLWGILIIFTIGLIGFMIISFLNLLPTREDLVIGLIVVLVIIVIAILIFLSIVPKE